MLSNFFLDYRIFFFLKHFLFLLVKSRIIDFKSKACILKWKKVWFYNRIKRKLFYHLENVIVRFFSASWIKFDRRRNHFLKSVWRSGPNGPVAVCSGSGDHPSVERRHLCLLLIDVCCCCCSVLFCLTLGACADPVVLGCCVVVQECIREDVSQGLADLWMLVCVTVSPRWSGA